MFIEFGGIIYNTNEISSFMRYTMSDGDIVILSYMNSSGPAHEKFSSLEAQESRWVEIKKILRCMEINNENQ